MNFPKTGHVSIKRLTGGGWSERSSAGHRLAISSVDFILELMFVHRCDRCCVYVKEMQLQGKTVFQGCNSVFVGN